jgi:hypothetical protein
MVDLSPILKLYGLLKREGITTDKIEWFVHTVNIGAYKIPEIQKQYAKVKDVLEAIDYKKTMAISSETRKDFGSKLGKPIYSFTLYEKIKRATLQNKNNNERYYPILMVSFDIHANHDSIIINKILPIIRGQQYSTLV